MIIVTGGAGFIGSNVLAALEEAGVKDLVAIDWLGKGEKWRNLAKRELAAVIPPEEMSEYLERHVGEIEALVHLGAVAGTDETDADLIVQSNFRLTWRLWCWCRERGKRFIYASSAAAYGDGALGFDDADDLEHLNALRPLDCCGWSKALFDRKVAREIYEGRGTPPQHVGLRLFSVYGPNEYHLGVDRSAVARIFAAARRGEEVKLFKSYNPDYADGGQLRDFVWVGDVVRVILWMLKRPRVSGLFNVGSGEARSFRELAEATCAVLGQEAKIGYAEMPEEMRGRFPYYAKADLTKLRAVGYDRPMTRLEDGVKAYISGYLAQPDPYR